MQYLKKRKLADKKLISSLSEQTGVSEEICELLIMRNIDTADNITEFINAYLENLTPFERYDNMVEVAKRITLAAEYGQRIVIYGDYDCDGVCATSILYMFFTSLGIETFYYIPNRKREGYGINREALEEIAENYMPDIVITVDCGISSYEDIAYAEEELGLEIIVTDHHEPPKILPDCLIIDPKIALHKDTFNELCGAGIALRLCEAIGGKKALLMYLDIATLATIADIVPLINDNRIIVSYGLKIINSRARQSIKLLLESANIIGEASSTDIAFKVVPKINAIGRLSDSLKAVSMFVDDDYFYAKSLVTTANEYNKERQIFTDDLVKDCIGKLESYDLEKNRVIVLYSKFWEAGVLGIACSKLAELFRRPVILLTYSDNIYKGSCRSVEGINLYECLTACSPFLKSFGGHAMACGLCIEEANLEGFVFAINEYIKKVGDEPFLPYCYYDLESDCTNINPSLIDSFSILEPFGANNPNISFICETKEQFSRITTTGHTKCFVNQQCELVNFNSVKNINLINNSKRSLALAEFNNVVFNNRRYSQGIVRKMVFENKDFIGEDNYFAVKQLYLLKYGNKTIFNVEYIDNEKVNKLLDGIFGTLLICNDIKTFNSYNCKESIVKADVNTFSDDNNYNRIILDLDLSQNLVFYKKIIFLDTPLNLGYIDFLKLNRECKVYIVKNTNPHKIKAIAKTNFPEVDKMRGIFLTCKKILQKNKISNVSALYDEYKKYDEEGIICFYIAFYVFFELKFIKFNSSLYVDNTVKSNLENSEIYNNIKEFICGGENNGGKNTNTKV